MDSELRNMVMAFRVTELQNLLGHFNKNKNGRKNELQARALELVKVNNSAIVSKIRELYRSIQLSLNQPLPASAVLAHNQQFANAGISPGRLFNSGMNSTSGDKLQYQNRYPNAFGQLPGLQVISHNSRVPICPDVQLKSLPFYDVMAQLTRPTSLLSTSTTGRAHEANFTFFLTPSQAGDIASSKEFNNSLNECKVQYTIQVQIRFCALETGTPQDDLFPPSMQVKVNNRSVPLPHPIPSNRPGVEPKRPSRPLNVTNFVKNSPTVTNNVNVTWASDSSARDYVISINLVKKLVSADLLARLKSKGPRPSDYTKGMVKEMVRRDDADCIASSTFKVSVACPLGKCRMSLPCRASTCKHLQCFDANLYLQMNEKKPVWSCPVCDKYTAFEDLAIDGYFQEVITSLSNSGEICNEIEVMQDGSWAPLKVKKEPDEPPTKRIKQCKVDDTICLDDDDIAVISDGDGESSKKNTTVQKEPSAVVEKPKRPQEIIDLTFTSDDDDSKDSSSSSSSSKSGESSSSEEEEVIKPTRKRKKPEFVIQDSSSTDTTLDEPSPKTVTPAPAARPPPPSTPDCITLDSPSSSPRPSDTALEQNKGTTNAGEKRASSTTETSESGPPSKQNSAPPSSTRTLTFSENLIGSTPPPSSFNTMPLFGAPAGLPPTTGVGMAHGGPDGTFPPPNPFSSLAWDNATTFPSDFSSLDFPSMDYFNQGSSFGGTSRPGNPPPGFGGPRYF